MRSPDSFFQLPEEVFDEEVNYILDMGVHKLINTYVF